MRWGITGGSGSLGSALIAELIRRGIGPIVTMSRDEMKTNIINERYGGLSGDVRAHTIPSGLSDTGRMAQIFRGCDILIHAAALKRVDQFTYGPSENMFTANILGTKNILEMAVACGIKKVLVISSDKASAPTNPYGISKAMAECLAVEQNAYSYPRGTKIAVARWGNCMGSRGSVLGIWKEQAAAGGPLMLTDERMTRFWLTIDQAIGHILRWTDTIRGGEIFIPILPSAKLIDLAEAIAPDIPVKIIGRRAGGEKLAEQLLNEEEPCRTIKRDDYYIVTPSVRSWSTESYPGMPVPSDLVYRSDKTDRWMTVEELRALAFPKEVTV